MNIIVPIKRFQSAKSRLAGRMGEAEREVLAELLAVSVLEQLARVRSVGHVVVASSEPSIGGLVARLGFELLVDYPPNLGLNAVIERAIQHASSSGATDIGVVFSDLPFFSASEFERIVSLHLSGAPRQVTLVLDRFGAGTNVRLCRPGGIIPSLYGKQSAFEHRKAAINSGAELHVVASDQLSHDLDSPADLDAIVDLDPGFMLPLVLKTVLEKWSGNKNQERQNECA